MSNWGDPEVAMAVRDLVGQIVHEHLMTLRPVPRYGTVTEVNSTTGYVKILLSGETDPVEYPWSDGALPIVGERVRVNGPNTDRYAERAQPYGGFGVGDIKWTIATTPDPGCVFMTGQTLVNAQTLHKRLWARTPSNLKSGSNIILPDARGRAFVCRHDGDADWDVIGEVRGAKTHQLSISEMPSHGHGGLTGDANANHEHDISANTGGFGFMRRTAWNGSNWDATFVNNGSASVEFHTYAQTQGFDAQHQHGIPSQGGDGSHNNIQPSVVFQAMLMIGLAGLD